MRLNFKIKSYLPIIIILVLLVIFFSFGLHRYFSIEEFKLYHQSLISYVHEHPFLASFFFVILYIFLVAISFPGASILSILGGFLFGTFMGSLYVAIAATIGAFIIFWAAKLAFSVKLYEKSKPYLAKIDKEFQKNAFSYLLFLRLVPIFPFFVVNILPAFLNVKWQTYLITTFLGILPGVLIYVSLGAGLDHILKFDQLSLDIIFEKQILLPLLGLALLSLIPIIYQRIRKNNK